MILFAEHLLGSLLLFFGIMDTSICDTASCPSCSGNTGAKIG